MINFLQNNFQLSLHGFLVFLASCLSLTVGLMVLFKDMRSPVCRSFFLITLTGGLWLLWYAFLFTAKPAWINYLALGIGYLVAVPYISPSVYIFSENWTGIRRHPSIRKIGFVLAFILGLTMFLFPDKICGIRQHPWGPFNHYLATPFAIIYTILLLVHFFTYAALAYRNFHIRWKNSTVPHQKLQFKFFIIGFLAGYTGSVDFLVALGFPFYPFGYISFSIFISIIAYAIIKHRLMDIQIVIRRLGTILLIYLGLGVVIIPLSFPLITNLLKNQNNNPSLVVLSVGLIAGILFSTGPWIYAYFLRNSFWLKGHLTTGLTHELKSPISSIMGSTEVMFDMLKDPVPDKSKSIEYLSMIQNNAARLESFVKDLLNVAKTESDEFQLEKNVFGLNDVILSIMENYKPLARQKGLTIQLLSDEKIEIEADQSKIQQVFSNLISNSIKFSNQGTVAITIKKSNSGKLDQLLCSIQDEGKGIAPKNLERIFDRFYQVHQQTTKGSGIGLTIAKAWVEAHGGHIWAESEGEGK